MYQLMSSNAHDSSILVLSAEFEVLTNGQFNFKNKSIIIIKSDNALYAVGEFIVCNVQDAPSSIILSSITNNIGCVLIRNSNNNDRLLLIPKDYTPTHFEFVIDNYISLKHKDFKVPMFSLSEGMSFLFVNNSITVSLNGATVFNVYVQEN